MDTLSLFQIIILIVAVIISILMIVAILTIPKIAKHTKAQLKLTGLMAKKAGIDRDVIQLIVNDADSNILAENGHQFEKQIFS